MKELNIGIRSSPYLADHGFQDMVVLPGSFYIETALSMEKPAPIAVRDVTFQNPIILSSEDSLIKVEVKKRGNGSVQYAFFESGSDECAARLDIVHLSTPPPHDDLSIEAFQAQAQTIVDAESFYGRLRENGNQYGPHFQRVERIWRAADQALGKIHARSELNACLLDAVTQSLAPFVMEQGKTFILKSIDRIPAARAGRCEGPAAPTWRTARCPTHRFHPAQRRTNSRLR